MVSSRLISTWRGNITLDPCMSTIIIGWPCKEEVGEALMASKSLLALDACRPSVAITHQGDWARVRSPLRIEAWEEGLVSHPDRQFADYVCKGIREGFRIGFDRSRTVCKPASGNMKSVEEHEEIVEEYIQKEKQAGRLIGPLNQTSHPGIQLSPFGVIPKSEPGKWRLITDLSSPGQHSVNDGIDRELCSLTYLTVDQVAEKVLAMGKGALMAKFDLKSAYRNVPVHPDDRELLGMIWKDQLYVDTALPFGLRSAPKIFNAVAEALAYMIREKGVGWLEHYLDDYVIVGPPQSPRCRKDLIVALDTCGEVGFPVAVDKTGWPATLMTLLGIEFDSVKQELRLPEDKLQKLKKLVAGWRRRKVCTRRELQSLAGHLSHACKVVRPGRRFLRGLFGLLSTFRRRDHFIRLNAAFRADLEWWHVFLSPWNGVAMMWDARAAETVEMWSDASGSWGAGAWCGQQWCQIAWSDWPTFVGAVIAAKELLPIIVAVAVWGWGWRGQTVKCHCDNQAVVDAIKGGYCRDPAMAHMLRCLFYLEARHEIRLIAVHVPGVQNGAADAISRNKLKTFFSLVPQAQPEPQQYPQALVEGLVVQRLWSYNDWMTWLDSMSELPSPPRHGECMPRGSGDT